MAVKDNVVFKCFYYKPKEKYNAITQADKIKKRDFLSCNSSYNYVSYVDTGASNKLPKDFTDYVGNNEKSCGAFNQNGLLNDKQKKELKEMLRTTQSCIWDCVISFREDFGEKYCRDYEQAFNFVKSELPKFFTRAGLNKDNIIWYAGLHENTDNKHIHISFFEKEPEYYKNGGKLSYHNGTIPKQVLIDSKRIFEQKLTNATAEIVKARKDLIERYNIDLSPFKLTKKAKQMMLNLYDQMPKFGRISYDSENMLELKKQVDNITEFLLCGNNQTYKSYCDFQDKLCELNEWQSERDYAISNQYNEDMFRRLGNKNIEIAMQIGRLRDRVKNQEIFNSRQRYFEKKMRAKQLDYLLDCLEYYAKVEQQEMDNFKAYCDHLEYLRKKSEYENSRHYDYEM